MDMSFSAADLAFRDEVRAFLAENLTDDLRREARLATGVWVDRDVALRWQSLLHRRGWAAPSWPKRHGGAEWTITQRYLFEQECAKADAPVLVAMGLRMVGPVLIGYGTEAQKNFYLPRILSGEDYWCQGYSEPGAGSDLAALKMSAVADGDDYILNGSKIWTTHAQFANRIFCLVRTATTGKRQDGISFLLVDLATPGVEIRPIITMGGDHEVNQVFFTDVRTPQSDRVGAEGQGWEIAKYLLEFERGGGMSAGRLRRVFDHLLAIADDRRFGAAPLDDPALADRLAQIDIDITALEMTELRVMSALETGQNPGPISSMFKIRSTELWQAITEATVDAVGPYALPWTPTRPLSAANEPPIGPDYAAHAAPTYLNYRAASIYGGSNEIQRDIIARALLRL